MNQFKRQLNMRGLKALRLVLRGALWVAWFDQARSPSKVLKEWPYSRWPVACGVHVQLSLVGLRNELLYALLLSAED